VEITFDTSQLHALVADLTAGATRVGAEAAAGFRETARSVETDMKAAIVQQGLVDTGTMRDSVSTTLEGDVAGGLRAEIGPTVDYAQYVRYGTSRIAPHDFTNAPLDRGAEQLTTALERIAAGLL
jgi:hypothetical protein